MSYNITNVSIKRVYAILTEERLKKFIIDTVFESFGGEWVIDRSRGNELTLEANQDGTEVTFEKQGNLYRLIKIAFSSSFDPGDLPDQIHQLIKDVGGELEAVYVWEGGDSINRVTIENGVITSKELT
jgi:hypothetical protein